MMSKDPELRYLGRVVVKIYIDDEYLEELVTQAVADNINRALHFRVEEE